MICDDFANKKKDMNAFNLNQNEHQSNAEKKDHVFPGVAIATSVHGLGSTDATLLLVTESRTAGFFFLLLVTNSFSAISAFLFAIFPSK